MRIQVPLYSIPSSFGDVHCDNGCCYVESVADQRVNHRSLIREILAGYAPAVLMEGS